MGHLRSETLPGHTDPAAVAAAAADMRTLQLVCLVAGLACAAAQSGGQQKFLGNLLVESTTVTSTTTSTSTMTPYCYASAGVSCSKRRRRRSAVAMALPFEDEEMHVVERRSVPMAGQRAARQLFTVTVTSVSTSTAYVTASTTNTVTPVCDYTNAYPLCYTPTSIVSTASTAAHTKQIVATSITATTATIVSETLTASVTYTYATSISTQTTTTATKLLTPTVEVSPISTVFTTVTATDS